MQLCFSQVGVLVKTIGLLFSTYEREKKWILSFYFYRQRFKKFIFAIFGKERQNREFFYFRSMKSLILVNS